MGAWFIAVNRKNGLSLEKIYESMAESTQERRYKNDWVVELLPGNDDYDFGYNYLECGVCKRCRDGGCFDLAQYLCKLDFMMNEIMEL